MMRVLLFGFFLFFISIFYDKIFLEIEICYNIKDIFMKNAALKFFSDFKPVSAKKRCNDGARKQIYEK